MIRLLYRIFTSRLFKLLFKFIGSLASAVLVISGYIAFLNYSGRLNKEISETPTDSPDDDEDET